MFGLSTEHLLIFGAILLIFGGKKIPELGAGLGKGIRSFKEAMDTKSAIEENKDEKQA